ncbi:MAG: hypothetical protein ISR49_05005 [Alphaproteobacteria bacterium]|nr:hypothetical protein [Alphaproteobacteria bacterium]
MIAALASAADAKPTCVVIHAPGHQALVHRIAEAVRAALMRSHAFVIGNGRTERSLHITVRHEAPRLPGEAPPFPTGPSTIYVSFEYREPDPKARFFEGSDTMGLKCDERGMYRCVDQIVRLAYVHRHINHAVMESGSPLPPCMYMLSRHCTSSAQ